MKRHLLFISAIAIVGLFAAETLAQAQAKAPAGSTAECRDGTFSSEANRDAACAANRGVKEWWGRSAPATRPALPATSTTGAINKTPTGKPVEVPANQVIADPATKMYQLCLSSEDVAPPVDASAGNKPARPPGDQMSEDEAKSRGFRPGAHKVNCGG